MSSRIARVASEVHAPVAVPAQRVAAPDLEEPEDEELDDPCPGCGGPVKVLIGGAHCDSDESCGWMERF